MRGYVNKLKPLSMDILTGAVIAAAGKSSRMGFFKPLLPLGSSIILQRIIDTLKAGGVGEIVVITGKNADIIENALRDSRVRFIHNKDYEISDMFYSALLGMTFLSKRTEAVFFTPADIPLFSAATVEKLVMTMKNSETDILIPCFNDGPGHPVLLRSSAVKELAGYAGQEGLRGAIEAYPGPKLLLLVEDPGIKYDSDTPEDYKLVSLMADVKMPDHIRRHCVLVSRLAQTVAAALVKQGLSLTVKDIETAALLHDMCRAENNHAEAAAAVLHGVGLDRLAEIVCSHMKLRDQDKDKVNEQVILYLADKMADGDRPVTIEERFEKRIKAVTGEQGKATVMDNYQTALGVKKRIENILGQEIYKILRIPFS